MSEEVLDRLIREAEEAGSDAPPPSASSGQSEAVSAAASPLAAVLANPTVLSALPKLLASTRGEGASLPAHGKGGHPDRHTALLCAIKPYLGRERQQTADQLISLCRLWDGLQSSGVLQMLPALMGGQGNASNGEKTEV